MERGKIAQWLFIGLAIILFWQFGGGGGLFGKGSVDIAPRPPAITMPTDSTESPRQAEDSCTVQGKRFEAELSSRGASLRNVWLSDYMTTAGGKDRLNLVAPTREDTAPLSTSLRLASGDANQIPYDVLDWKITDRKNDACTFVYEDASSRVTKTVRATDKPFELETFIEVKNIADAPRKHRLAVDQTSWKTAAQTEGSLGRISEHMTEVITATNDKTERLGPDAFDAGDYKDPEFTPEHWRRTPGAAKWVSVSSVYFTKVAIPLEGPAPAAEAWIDEQWTPGVPAANRAKDPNFGHVYHARLAYPEVELAAQATQTYKVLSFTGPKERDVLAAVTHDVGEVINLGTFSPIAKVLVGYVNILHRAVGSWGWAICLLTITVRMLLFPLSISQIKSSATMRRLKPEMDALNERFKDDPAQKGLAVQELWRKHGVNPVVGCIPVLLQMPVWFALYQALQTAVELYHEPFLSARVIPDLSDAGKFFVIPAILGASSFFQQRLMPPQGDPMQQKMMQYLLPGIFVVMMLYLPAGLGVYMLTNTWLGIAQQVAVERYLKAKTQGSADIEVREKPVKTSGDDEKSPPALGKGKARVRG